jgi:hypothetical protein
MKQINEIDDLSEYQNDDDIIVDINNEELVQNIEIMTDQLGQDIQNNAQ